MTTSSRLEFTGERYVPGVEGQIELEHRHRYHLASQLVKDKRVLDIACGEGYGSAILAQTAALVYGVDIDLKTVDHARATYPQSNLTFINGSCDHIPLPSGSIDFVVSFETLEHIREQEQTLTEIRRVLTPEGVLLMSTPNRRIYSAAHGQPNPFHVRELDFNEFQSLIARHFRSSGFFGQRVVYGSLIAPFCPQQTDFELVSLDGQRAWPVGSDDDWRRYFLAIASNGALPGLPASVLGFGATEDYRNGVIAELSQTIARMREQHENQARGLREQFEKAIRDQQALADMKARTEQLREQEITRLKQSFSWRVTRPMREIGRWGRRLRRDTRRYRQMVMLAGRSRTAFGPPHTTSPGHPQGTSAILRFVKRVRKKTRPLRYFLMRKPLPAWPGGPSIGPCRRAQASTVPQIFHIDRRSADFTPLVSVIVPAYNHAQFLKARLDSISAQTYRNFEVILLDDQSTDASAILLQEFQNHFPDRSRLLINSVNSGSPFLQWEKGMRMARGDLIWIAESDDVSSVDFLAALMPMFANPAVRMAFCKTRFIDASDRVVWTTDEYLQNISPEIWQRPFIQAAASLARRAWVFKNIVPNVSSAVFRKPADFDSLRTCGWTDFKVCGDWVLYLQLCRGGLVGFSDRYLNFYRQHATNTSVSRHKAEDFYIEHARVLRFAQSCYHITPNERKGHIQLTMELWRHNRPDDSPEFIERTYRQIAAPSPRRINILIVGFALTSGGGEVFPIVLANALQTMNCNVTFLNFHREPTIDAIRRRLNPDIPLLELEDLTDLPLIIDEMEIDVIHTHHAWADTTVALLLAGNSRCALVCTTHGMYEGMDPDILNHAIPLLNRRMDRLCYAAEKNLAPFTREFLVDKRITRISNAPASIPLHGATRAELNVPDSAFLISLVSRALPEKGWAEAIEAVVKARESSGRDIHLLLIGNGPEYNRLAPLEQRHFIHFLGFRDDVVSLFSIADIGLLPTRFSGESFPLVILECLSARRPLITTDIGDIRRMMTTPEGPAGIIVSLCGGQIPVHGLAQAIASVATDNGLLRTLQSRATHLHDRCSPKAIAAGYKSVYLEAAIQRNPDCGLCDG